MAESGRGSPQINPFNASFDIAWNPPTPRGLPRLRARLAEQMLSTQEFQRMLTCVQRGQMTKAFTTDADALTAVKLLNEEYERLAAASLYYATAEMTQLAIAAARSLPDFDLEAEDVPAKAGFMVFADPVHRYDEPGGGDCPPLRVPIVAMSWGPSSLFTDHDPYKTGGIWITQWSPFGDDLHAHLDHHKGIPHTPKRLQQLRNAFAPLQWDNEVPWRFGKGHTSVVRGRQMVTATPMQVLRAAWLLMQQPQLLDHADIPRPRSEQKLDVRQGLSRAPVRVLRLRVATREGDARDSDGSAAREYQCRWLVSGHWRQQWYPNRGVHRPVWIAPHVKGPGDKPLKTAETVHLWDR